MAKTPKERIIFDDSVYDEDYLREQLEERYVAYGEMEELNDDFVDEHWYLLDEYRQADYEEDVGALADYFSGQPSGVSSVVSPNSGNPIIVSGTIERWDGARSGFSVFKDLDDVLNGEDSPFKDCEIRKVWDENGQLFIHGTHHDGGVTVELRQLSNKGAETYALLEALSSLHEEIDLASLTMERHWSIDGVETREVIEVMRDLWENPKFAQTPHYMERAFGCKAKEWVPDPLSLDQIGFEEQPSGVSLKGEAAAVRSASQALEDVTSHAVPVHEAR